METKEEIREWLKSIANVELENLTNAKAELKECDYENLGENRKGAIFANMSAYRHACYIVRMCYEYDVCKRIAKKMDDILEKREFEVCEFDKELFTSKLKADIKSIKEYNSYHAIYTLIAKAEVIDSNFLPLLEKMLEIRAIKLKRDFKDLLSEHFINSRELKDSEYRTISMNMRMFAWGNCDANSANAMAYNILGGERRSVYSTIIKEAFEYSINNALNILNDVFKIKTSLNSKSIARVNVLKDYKQYLESIQKELQIIENYADVNANEYGKTNESNESNTTTHKRKKP